MKVPAALANAVLVLVSLVWAGNFVASLLLPQYRADSSLNFVFMTIVGGALALRGGEGGGLPARLVAALRPPPHPPAPPTTSAAATPSEERP